MRRIFLFEFLCLLLCLFALPGLAQEDAPALRGWVKGEGYRYVLLGSYPYEKNGDEAAVLWRVLRVEDGQALLLSEQILDVHPVLVVEDPKVVEERSYRRISDFTESDLYPWLQEVMAQALFSDAEQSMLTGDRGLLFLPDADEYCTAAYGFTASVYGTQKTRWAKSTPYAVGKGIFVSQEGTSGYWLDDVKAPEDYKLRIVGYNGHLSYGAYSRKDLGLRVATLLDLDRCAITAGEGTRDAPFQLTSIGEAPAATPAPEPVATEAPAEPRLPAETAAPSPAPEATQEPPPADDAGDGDTLVLSFVGDCSTGETFQFKGFENSYTAVADAKGYDWPFSLVREALEADDLTIGNLELVLTERTKHSSRMYNLVAAPQYVEILKHSGIDAFNTVNNHAMDFLPEGYQDTLATLDEAGLAHFGTIHPGNDEREVDQPLVLTVTGVSIGLLGFTYPDINTPKHMLERIEALKAQGTDLVVVSLHWGREEHDAPEYGQLELAQRLIDAGADVVYGHHPHILQPIHIYQGKPIFYSTGNFTFGTIKQLDPDTGIFQLHYNLADGVELRELAVLPARTQGTGDYRPYLLEDAAEQQAVWKKLVMRKQSETFQNPPPSFLETGRIRFAGGEMVTE